MSMGLVRNATHYPVLLISKTVADNFALEELQVGRNATEQYRGDVKTDKRYTFPGTGLKQKLACCRKQLKSNY